MENSLRLRYGLNKYSGRLEIFHNRIWGGICDDFFSLTDANVACRQLGFDGARSFKCCSLLYLNDNRSIGLYHRGIYWLDDLKCSGNEAELASCLHAGWGRSNCRINEAVSVECYGKTLHNLFHL